MHPRIIAEQNHRSNQTAVEAAWSLASPEEKERLERLTAHPGSYGNKDPLKAGTRNSAVLAILAEAAKDQAGRIEKLESEIRKLKKK